MKYLLDEINSISLEDLNHQRVVIGLESVGASQTLSASASKLPRFLDEIKGFVLSKLNPFKHSVDLVDSRVIEEKFRQIDYIQASNLGVVVPVGFKGTWLDYVAVLGDSQKVVSAMRDGLLKPFEVFLAEMLNSPDQLRSNTINPQLARYKSNTMEPLKIEFAKFISNGSKTEATYGDVVKRHNDLPLVTRNLNDINTAFASIDRSVLIKQVTSISDLLDKLITNIKEDPETYVISGTCLKSLTDLTYFMAREVEYYTTHGYFLETFTLSVKDSYAMLKQAVDR